ncbi:DNA transposase THAP9, partial [Paramuricea clavata]
MPRANCSIFGCGTNRRHTGVGIFRIPSGNDERSKAIRDEWIRIITKYCVVDANFRKQIESGNVYVCERHFKKEEIEC